MEGQQDSSFAVPELPLCCMCDSLAAKVCGICHCNRYCSPECQKDDWKVHKLVCKPYSQKFSSHQRPGPNYYRGIYCNPDGDYPEFVWLAYEQMGRDNQYGINFGQLPGLRDLFSNGDFVQTDQISSNSVLHRRVQPPIIVHGCVGPIDQDSFRGKDNISLSKVNEELPTAFHGPLVFHKKQQDLDPMDFRHIVDSARVRFQKPWKETHHKGWALGDTVVGVRVNCIGDIKIFGYPMFEPVKCPVAVAESKELQAEAPVGEIVGIPLAFGSYPHSLAWADHFNRGWWMNSTYVALNPSHHDYMVGTVFVARRDKKPLPVGHLQALIEYCWDLPGQFVDLEGLEAGRKDFRSAVDTDFDKRNELLLRRASKEGFMEFWRKCLTEERYRLYRDIPAPWEF
ncbi:hypothetical protein BDV96DRAFT_651812 [Lophiotrema nucula]|uniref:MYND-type domain-containing protein n=1 Tax=Lophiotrema nucula TaxID=690887 RepID=A0A6A5YQX2_9PLEO|nr:hypothetical protein BDV96DRAFT_651812 [Lophiotrema nucula]